MLRNNQQSHNLIGPYRIRNSRRKLNCIHGLGVSLIPRPAIAAYDTSSEKLSRPGNEATMYHVCIYLCFIYATVYCACSYIAYSLSLQIIAFMVLFAVSHASCVIVPGAH